MLAPRWILVRVLVLGGCCWACTAAAGEVEEQLAADEKELKDAGLSTDGPGLLDFFRKRTLSEADKANLKAAVRKLGDESFDERERASRHLVVIGRAALPFLRPALSDADPEIARRARRCVEEIEAPTNRLLPAVAARVVAARKPAGAAEVLLAFAPFADEEAIEEEVRLALVAVGLRDGKAAAPVLAALKDREPACRAAAAFVVGRATDAEQRRAAVRLLDDADVGVRFQAASALLLSRDKAAVPTLMALLNEGPADLGGRAQELLFRLAGDKAPPDALGQDAAARRQCRAAWEAWWKANADKADLAKVDFEGRPLGLTLVVEPQRPDGGGRVFECGRDGKPRWEVKVMNPIDAELLPGGRVLVADCNTNRVVEMNHQGKVLWSHAITSPLRCQRLPNGNTFIATYNAVTEVTRDGKIVYSYNRTHCYHAHKMRNGHILCIDSQGVVVELDGAGKEVHSVNAGGGIGQSWACVEPLANGRYLVALGGSGKVAEIDKAGKVFWERAVRNPNSATRLANGNTLVASHDDKCVYEFDRAGKEVWKRPTEGHPFRARRR